MLKKIIGLTLVATMLTSFSAFGVSAATNNSIGADNKLPKETTIALKTEYTTNAINESNTPNKLVITKDPLYDGMYNKDGKLNKIDKVKLKKALLEKWNKDAKANQKNIDNIDKVVDEIYNYAEKTNSVTDTNQLVAQGETIVTPLLFEEYSWSVAPYVTSTTPMVTYQTYWTVIDNYRSSIPLTIQESQSTTITKTLGFSGETQIKATISARAEYTESQTSTISKGYTISEWTVWGQRPYIDWNDERWTGYLKTHYYDLGVGGWVDNYKWVYGNNKVLTYKTTEHWSATNSSHSNTASAPMPPSGPPQ